MSIQPSFLSVHALLSSSVLFFIISQPWVKHKIFLSVLMKVFPVLGFYLSSMPKNSRRIPLPLPFFRCNNTAAIQEKLPLSLCAFFTIPGTPFAPGASATPLVPHTVPHRQPKERRQNRQDAPV
jgi:hypothetical protein